jgi:hypothetical protein
MDIQYVIFFAILLSFILVHVNQRLALDHLPYRRRVALPAL